MTATYMNSSTASGLVVFYDFRRRCLPSIDFTDDRISAASASSATVVEIGNLPDAVDGRYSFRDLYSLLDSAGQATFASEQAAFDARLRERFERNEVSPLYFFRCISGMTQERLAEMAGSRQSFLSQVEKRKRPLTWKQAKKFAAALGIEPRRLMEDEI